MITPPSLPVNIEVFHIKYTYQTVTKPKGALLTKRHIANGFSCNWRKEFNKQGNKVFWCDMFWLAKAIEAFRSQMHFAQCTSVEECPLYFDEVNGVLLFQFKPCKTVSSTFIWSKVLISRNFPVRGFVYNSASVFRQDLNTFVVSLIVYLIQCS